jgi:hypothetical protein
LQTTEHLELLILNHAHEIEVSHEHVLSFRNYIIHLGNDIAMSLDLNISACLDYEVILRNNTMQLRDGGFRHATSLPLQRNYAIQRPHWTHSANASVATDRTFDIDSHAFKDVKQRIWL